MTNADGQNRATTLLAGAAALGAVLPCAARRHGTPLEPYGAAHRVSHADQAAQSGQLAQQVCTDA